MTRALPTEVLQGLQFVECANADLDVSLLPNFFFAGPQRTGSTWLFSQFEPHPEVALSRPKELYFFNTTQKGVHHHQHVSNDLAWYLSHFERTDEQLAAQRRRCREDFGMDYAPKVRGEATASYAAGLDVARLADTVRIIPDLKVVITARNPIDRWWSHAKLDLCRERGRSVADTPTQEFVDYLDNKWPLRCGDYAEMQARFEAALKPDHLLIVSFDDIIERPIELLQRVARFLAIDDDVRYFNAEPDKGQNASESSRIPSQVRARLEEFYADGIAAAREQLGVDW